MSGRRLSLRSLKGKTVVLDFWATWCPPCRDELPAISRIAYSFSEKQVAVLGIDAAEAPDTVRWFLTAHPISFLMLLIYDNESPLEEYGVRGYPFLVLVDRNGIVGPLPAMRLPRWNPYCAVSCRSWWRQVMFRRPARVKKKASRS